MVSGSGEPSGVRDAFGKRTDRPARRWLRRFALVCVGSMVLAWAWMQSGMSNADRLWTNRSDAVDYIFGELRNEASAAEIASDAERQVRQRLHVEAVEALREEFRSRGERVPSTMQLGSFARDRVESRIAAMGEPAYRALVEAEISARSEGPPRREGGYFPIETSPVSIFGDPERVGRLPGFERWIVERTDEAAGPVPSATRWTLAAVGGDGYTGKLFETIAIAIWGTLLAVVLALPASLFGSSRTLALLAPGRSRAARVLRWFGRFVVRRSYDVARGFNEIVLAMIMVSVLGLGPLPGVIALCVHTYGVLAKVFAEAIDTIDSKPVEGVLSTGASSSQVIAYAVFPQVMPYVISQSLLRFESNVRGATVLGVVGAGGIGQMLYDKFTAFEFPEVATMMLIIIVVVTIIDLGCTRLMKRFV